MQVRRAEERGHTRIGWLDSRHSFSFGGYYDPDNTGYRSLRVLNDDRVAPGAGFGTHGHRDMEILSYVLEGALEHRDSSGGGGAIWIDPSERGLDPAYDQRSFDARRADEGFAVLASPDGREEGIRLHQDAVLAVARIAPGSRRERPLDPGRHAWLHVARGAVSLNGTALREGDAAAVAAVPTLSLETAGDAAEVLVFDLA